MRPIFPFFLLFIISLLAACAPSGPAAVRGEDAPWIKPDAPRPASVLDAALAYYAHVRTLGPNDWNRENETLKETYAKSPSDFQRLRQALLLLAPNAPAKEQARLVPLLDRLEKDTQKSAFGLHPLVVLLRSEFDERRRLEDKLREENKKNEELEQKLEALKNIEKNLLERRRVPPPVTKP
ncbi:MAG TPA: hypothetical protein PLW86_05390 [Rhodocyclaceae bacterium]|nr:hypothetical protein [Rhodocyclaceae bacterium]